MSGDASGPVLPIVDDAGLDAAISEVERLWDSPEDSPEAERLDLLATLIVAYERERYPMRRPSPDEMLRHAVQDMGRSRDGLAAIVGSGRLADLLLSGESPVTPAIARAVSEAWHLPYDCLVRDDDDQTP